MIVRGSWSVKVEAVLRRIKWILQQKTSTERLKNSIRHNDDDDDNDGSNDKVIIFTEWNEAMAILALSLSDNGIHAALFRGNMKII